tara:strand:+ start:925 stop:1455 length:531 start_codon:yes stop_codon:yes gene_type:complete
MSCLIYLKQNLLMSFTVAPWRAPLKAWLPFPVFAVLSLVLGLSSGIYQPGLLESDLFWILPLSLFVFPSLLEESFFRGVLIPKNTYQQGSKKIIQAMLISTAIFVAWHPFNAILFNNTAIGFFLDPIFLLMVAALGLSCSYAYIVSGSIWVPIIMHWLTVLVWVFFLGGRNLILES